VVLLKIQGCSRKDVVQVLILIDLSTINESRYLFDISRYGKNELQILFSTYDDLPF